MKSTHYFLLFTVRIARKKSRGNNNDRDVKTRSFIYRRCAVADRAVRDVIPKGLIPVYQLICVIAMLTYVPWLDCSKRELNNPYTGGIGG